MIKIKGNPLKVHGKVHFLKMNYSIGFYTGGGNIEDWNKLTKEDKKSKLQRDWYVWWSFRHPMTMTLERQEPNIKYGINGFKNKSLRLKAMREIKKELWSLLKTGYSPYDLPSTEPELISIEFAFYEALKVKKNEVKERTYEDYSIRIEKFKKYLHKNGFDKIKEIEKKTVASFLNKFGGKNSNNFRAALSSIFTVLSDLSYVEYNFIKELRTKKTEPKKIINPSGQQIKKALKLLQEQDEILLIYIYLVSFMFWRPIEAIRIEIKNIDLKKRTMTVDTKSKSNKVKYIPDIILNEIKVFIDNRDGKLFDLKADKEKNKRGYLSNQFKKFIKVNNLDSNLTPYSFRHYHITKAYLALRKNLTTENTIQELSLITGHTSKAIWNYIQVNDIELPGDYSKFLV